MELVTFNNEEEKDNTCCPTNVLLPEEPPITQKDALEIKSLFKILSNDTRIRLLHELARVEEICVCDLAKTLNMSPQAISNQLQRLLDQGIVATRRSGNMIYYRVIDKCVVALLKNALCLINDAKHPPIDESNQEAS